MTDSMLPRKVMIVDDSEIVLALAAHTLQGAGYRVVTHPHPAGCLALVLKEAPDLLLIDVNMPGLSGDTVVKMVGSAQLKSPMVVLLHSSLPADVLAQKVVASGANGFIRKTESSMELVRQVARWVKPSATSGTYSVGGSTRVDLQQVRDNHPTPAPVVSAPDSTPTRATILLVDYQMAELSEYRRLAMSEPGQLEFALSGAEVIRKLGSQCPPDIVVMGRLLGSPSCDDVLSEASQLDRSSKTRFILVRDVAEEVKHRGFGATVLRRPLTEASLCGAIRQCQRRAS